MRLRSERVNLKTMAIQVKGLRIIAQPLLCQSLKIEILIAAQVVIAQTLFLSRNLRLTLLLFLLSVGRKKSAEYK